MNRSDSDSAMPLYRRMPFQRSSKERRSLHVPTTTSQGGARSKSSNMDILTRTSIDLELDLAAQQSKLVVLSEEIDRLRQIKKQMEEAKGKGDKELPLWLQQDDKFQTLLTSVKMNHFIMRNNNFNSQFGYFSWRRNLPRKALKRGEWQSC